MRRRTHSDPQTGPADGLTLHIVTLGLLRAVQILSLTYLLTYWTVLLLLQSL